MFRALVSKKFRYRTNEFSLRSGFIEETFTNRNGLEKRIDYWKYTLHNNFDVQPGKKIGLFFTHTTFDYFAIVIAAMELRLQITVEHPGNSIDFILHTLPEQELQTYKNKKTPMYHYFDIADDFLPKDSKINISPQPTDICIMDMTQAQLYKHAKKSVFKGSILHTRYRNDEMLVDVLIPSLLSDKITFHVGSGFVDVKYGLEKLSKIISKIEIDHVVFYDNTIAHRFFKDIKNNNTSVWTYNPNLLKIDINYTHNNLLHGVDFDATKFTNIAYDYKIDGHFYVDYVYQKLYFGTIEPHEGKVMSVKKRILEDRIEKEYPNIKIDKFYHTGWIKNINDALEFFRLLDID